MGAARWGSLLVASFLFVPSSGALANDRDRDIGNDAGRIVQVQNRPYDYGRDDRRDRDRRRVYTGRDRGVRDIALNNGYNDGYEKGLDDGHDRRSFDPTRHKWYRSGNRNYNSRYGSRSQYENLYRDGFRSGYQAGYRDGDRYDHRRRSGFPRF